ncbi:MAG: succinylglutamate desuccinylase/aspartoacylase family protein, partial [Selenomonadaceae bacterium]|nr:succinylglutamate desuccinylase/aspartoacylase family protein [Selenomonadaceae bacterium]
MTWSQENCLIDNHRRNPVGKTRKASVTRERWGWGFADVSAAENPGGVQDFFMQHDCALFLREKGFFYWKKGEYMLHTVCFSNFHVEPCTKLRTLVDVPRTLNAIPTTFINGKYDGPTVLVTSGVHGSEYPGIAASMELGRDLDPEEIHGCLILMHP